MRSSTSASMAETTSGEKVARRSVTRPRLFAPRSRAAYLLDRMEEECPANTRRQLADYTANVILQLEDAGVSAEPIEILSDVRESSTLQAVDDCLDLFALYTILRKEQG